MKIASISSTVGASRTGRGGIWVGAVKPEEEDHLSAFWNNAMSAAVRSQHVEETYSFPALPSGSGGRYGSLVPALLWYRRSSAIARRLCAYTRRQTRQTGPGDPAVWNNNKGSIEFIRLAERT